MDNTEKVREILRELLDTEKRVEALRQKLRRLVAEELRRAIPSAREYSSMKSHSEKSSTPIESC